MLRRKLLRQEFLMVKLSWSNHFESLHLPSWLTLTEDLCHWWPRICCVCRNKILRQSFLCREFLQDVKNSNATSATKGSEIIPCPEHRGSSLVCVSQYLVFCMVFYRLLFVFSGLSLLAIALAVLWLRASDYHYGISILCSCVLKMGKYPNSYG